LKNKRRRRRRRRRREKRGQFNHEEADHVRWLGLFFSLRQTYGGKIKKKTTKRRNDQGNWCKKVLYGRHRRSI
jgi:hypothetical protein